jgi:hypothetical protein
MLIFFKPEGAGKVPGALKVALPAGIDPAPSTPIFEVPIAMF